MSEQTTDKVRTLSYRAALREALIEEMERDERVFLMGQDAGPFGGVFGVTKGLTEMFGEERVFDTPISEAFIVGGGVGAALAGARPVVELQYADFALISMDEIVNKAAKWRYMHGGGQSVPLVIRAPEGVVGGLGPEHSQSLAQYFWHSFGLKVAMPATPADAKGMLKSAIRDEDPVLFLENKSLYNRRGPVPEGEYLVPLGVAAQLREGDAVTVVAWSRMTTIAMKAADELAEKGIGCDIIDPRGIRPLEPSVQPRIVTPSREPVAPILDEPAPETASPRQGRTAAPFDPASYDALLQPFDEAPDRFRDVGAEAFTPEEWDDAGTAEPAFAQ